MADDDLRFGDVKGGSENKSTSNGEGGIDPLDMLIQFLTFLVIAYVVLKVAEILFDIAIPIV